MNNEIVKYQNQFNKVALRSFTANQLDLLIAICSRMREKGEDNIIFNFDYLKNLIKLEKNYTTDEFIEELVSVNKKLLSLNFTFETPSEIIQFALFSTFKINKDQLTLKVQVNKEFSFLLNNLSSEFTRFELEEFVSFKSSYTKEFFRRIMQFKATGIWKISLEEFKRLLDVPTSYTPSNIDKWVLSPISKELKKDYNLKIKKIYSKQGVGRPKLNGFEFRFKTEKTPQKEENKENIETYDSFNLYLYRTIKLYDKNCNRYNYLKIKRIEPLEDGKIKVYLLNLDDNYSNSIILNDAKHFFNFINNNII